MASLGEAIALQGVDTSAQQLGQLAYKQGVQRRQKGADINQKLGKYVQGVGKYHRLVQPEVQEVVTDVISKAASAKASGDPYWMNSVENDISMMNVKLSELQAKSQTFTDFDKKRSELDRGKLFSTPAFQKFEADYGKVSDYRDLQNRFQQGEYQGADNISFDPRGNIVYRFEDKVDYTTELTNQIKANVNPVMGYSEMVSAPFGKLEKTDVYVRPFMKVDAKKAFDDNPNMFPQGMPKSVEESVEEYMINNPSAVKQFMYRTGINMEYDENGALKPEVIETAKRGLMNQMKGLVYDDIKQKTYSPQTQINNYFGGGPEEEPDLKGIFNPMTFNYASGGKNTVAGTFNVSSQGKTNIIANTSFTDVNGKTKSGDLPNHKLVNIQFQPYKKVGNTKVFAKDGDNAIGVTPFLIFATESGQQKVLAPYSASGYTLDNFDITNKSEMGRYRAIINRWDEIEGEVANKIAKGEIKRTKQDILNYIKNTYGSI